MIISLREPAGAGFRPSPRSSDADDLPRLVIYQPAILYAEALEAVVQKYSGWRVSYAGADVGAAAEAATSGTTNALLFDVRTGTAVGAQTLTRRLRAACPELPLILVTQHDGPGFLGAAAVADVSAVVHHRDGVAELVAALDSVRRGFPYRSPSIAIRLEQKRRPRCASLRMHGAIMV
jgi:DNA-binding NarL/FixJ family response regulator